VGTEANWEGAHGLYRKYFGTLRIEDIIQENLSVIGHEKSDDLRYVIVDFLDVERSSINEDDMEKMSAFDQPAARIIKNLKIAFVVRGETQSALATLYGLDIPSATWEYRLFDSVEAARQWV
jgi:hypothetical protein